MDQPGQKIVKKEDNNQEESNIKCSDCEKVYPKESDLYAHMKSKHPAEGIEKSKPPKLFPKNRVLETQQNEHEDAIYAYLGELGEKNQETSSGKFDMLPFDDNQKLTGQTNYSVNKVVRTPYEKEIDPIQSIPKQAIQKSKYKNFYLQLSQQIAIFHKKIQLEKDKWEFRDPMAPEQETQDQFSLMDIRKLINNYPRREIKAKFPHFCIFMLWIGRICKSSAWQQIFLVIGEFLALYREFKAECDDEAKKSIEYFGKIFQEKNDYKISSENFDVCDSKTIEKIIQCYVKWVQLFGVSKFC